VKATEAGHSALAVYGINRVRLLEYWDHWFDSHSSHVCLCAFILRRADLQPNESYPLCLGSGNWREEAKDQQWAVE
jgi:hypothetical protein